MIGRQAMRSRWSHRAVIVPAATAGTMYAASLILAVQALCPAENWPVGPFSPELITSIPIFLGMASLVGATIACVPIWLGVALMTRLGDHNPGLRHPALWAMVGAASAAGITAPFTGWDAPQAPVLALWFTGAGCAALARRYVRWPESEE